MLGGKEIKQAKEANKKEQNRTFNGQRGRQIWQFCDAISFPAAGETSVPAAAEVELDDDHSDGRASQLARLSRWWPAGSSIPGMSAGQHSTRFRAAASGAIRNGKKVDFTWLRGLTLHWRMIRVGLGKKEEVEEGQKIIER